MEASRWLKNKIRVYGKFDADYLFHHAPYMVMGNGSLFVANLLTALALTALLPIETYGTYAYLLAIIGFFGSFVLNGVNNAVAQAVARNGKNVLREAFALHARWSMPAIMAFLAYCAYLFLTGKGTTFVAALLILGLSFFLTNALSAGGAVLFGKKEFKRLGYATAGSALATCALVGAAASTGNLLILSCAYALSSIGPAAYLYHCAQKRSEPEQSTEEGRLIMRFSMHLSAVSALSSLADSIDKIALFIFLGPAELALYFFTVQLADAGKALVKSAVSVLTPKLAVTELQAIRKHFLRHISIGMALGAGVAAAYWIGGAYAIPIFFPQYGTAVEYVRILSLGFIFIVPITYTAYIFQSHKMIGAMYSLSVIPNSLRLIGYVAGAWLGGVAGVVWTRVAIYLISFSLNMLWICKDPMKTKSPE